MDTLTAFVVSIAALSTTVERVVEIIKGYSGWLRETPKAQEDPGAVRKCQAFGCAPDPRCRRGCRNRLRHRSPYAFQLAARGRISRSTPLAGRRVSRADGQRWLWALEPRA